MTSKKSSITDYLRLKAGDEMKGRKTKEKGVENIGSESSDESVSDSIVCANNPTTFMEGHTIENEKYKEDASTVYPIMCQRHVRHRQCQWIYRLRHRRVHHNINLKNTPRLYIEENTAPFVRNGMLHFHGLNILRVLIVFLVLLVDNLHYLMCMLKNHSPL